MSTPEAKVRDPVVKFAKSLGIGHIRMSFGRGAKKGRPDDQFLPTGGRPIFWEFKAPGKKPTQLQFERMRELRVLGYDVGWSDNIDTARCALASRVGAGALYAQSLRPLGRSACGWVSFGPWTAQDEHYFSRVFDAV